MPKDNIPCFVLPKNMTKKSRKLFEKLQRMKKQKEIALKVGEFA